MHDFFLLVICDNIQRTKIKEFYRNVHLVCCKNIYQTWHQWDRAIYSVHRYNRANANEFVASISTMATFHTNLFQPTWSKSFFAWLAIRIQLKCFWLVGKEYQLVSHRDSPNTPMQIFNFIRYPPTRYPQDLQVRNSSSGQAVTWHDSSQARCKPCNQICIARKKKDD